MACDTCEKRHSLRRTGGLTAAAGILLFALPFVAGCGGKVALIKAAAADVEPISRTVSTNGKVELIDDFQAHANAAGQIKQIFVKVGDTVRPGEELIRLDDADARMRLESADVAVAAAQNGVATLKAGGNGDEVLAAKSDMTAAQLNVQQATTRLGTLQTLQARGTASANEVAAAQTQVTEAQNRVTALQARRTGRFSSGDIALQQDQVAKARAEVSSAASDLANFDIRSPIGGTVYGLPTAAYAQVIAGQDLVNVADLNKIRVRAFFDEPEIGRLAVGQAVRITWEARPDRTWHGHIAAVPTSITNYGTRNVGECLITVDDARGDLIPNVNVTLYVTTVHKDNVLTIPHEALRTNGASAYVYKVVNGKLEKTVIAAGVVSQTRVEVVSGLQAGDVVALLPMNDVELKNGLAVRVQP